MDKGIDSSKRLFLRMGLGIAVMGMTTDAFPGHWNGMGERLGSNDPLNKKPFRTPGMTCREEGADVVLTDMRRGKDLLKMNDTAAYVYRRCDGHRSIADIADHFSDHYDRPASNSLEDVVLVVQVLGRYNAVSF